MTYDDIRKDYRGTLARMDPLGSKNFLQRPNSQQQLHEVTNAHWSTRLPFETMQKGDNN